MGKIKTEAEKKKTRQAAYLRRKYRIENYVGSDKHISNASTGAGVSGGAITFSAVGGGGMGLKTGELASLKSDAMKNPALKYDPAYIREVKRVKAKAPITKGLLLALPVGLGVKLLHKRRLKKFHKKKRVRKGWEKTAFVSKPISFMNRSELQKKKSDLIGAYYGGPGSSRAVGAAVGSSIGVPLAMLAKQIQNPSTKSFFKKAVIPSAIAGAILGATQAPKIRRKQIVRDLYKVQDRLKQTNYSRVSKGF